MLIRDAIEDFTLNQEILSRAERYVRLCTYTLEEFETFLYKQYKVTTIEDVKTAHIKQLIKHWQQSGRLKNITINGNIARVKSLYTFLIEEEYIRREDNPTRFIKNLKEEKTVIRTFNDREVRALIKDCEGRTYSNIRDTLMLMLLFDCGLRVSELIGIKPGDINRNGLLVRGKGSKQRLMYISPRVKRQMNKFKFAKEKRFSNWEPEELEDYYFLTQSGKKVTRTRINQMLKEHGKNVGVRAGVRCCPHDCRHYFAQKQLRNGIDIYSLSRLLGHYDTTITATYLKGLDDEIIVKHGVKTSPLQNLKQ